MLNKHRKSEKIRGFCLFGFFTNLVLDFHMESSINMENKNFTCEICEKSFSSNQYKNKHLSVVHGEEKKLYVMYVANHFIEKMN